MLHVLCVVIVWFVEVRVLGFLLFFSILASVLYMFLISTNCNYTYTLGLHKINSVIKTVSIHSSVDPILSLMKCYQYIHVRVQGSLTHSSSFSVAFRTLAGLLLILKSLKWRF